jgi:hypothetical protein
LRAGAFAVVAEPTVNAMNRDYLRTSHINNAFHPPGGRILRLLIPDLG